MKSCFLFHFLFVSPEDEETERDEEDEEDTGLTHREVFTQNPTVAEGGVAPSREPLQPSMEEEEELEEEEHRFKGTCCTFYCTPPQRYCEYSSLPSVSQASWPVGVCLMLCGVTATCWRRRSSARPPSSEGSGPVV